MTTKKAAKTAANKTTIKTSAKAGRKPTPVKERLRKSRAKLVQGGGSRLSINLSALGTQALRELMKHDSGSTQSEVVERALLMESMVRRQERARKDATPAAGHIRVLPGDGKQQ